jgi:hypothetical protein
MWSTVTYEYRLEGCRGFNGPYPSAPLDELYSVVKSG